MLWLVRRDVVRVFLTLVLALAWPVHLAASAAEIPILPGSDADNSDSSFYVHGEENVIVVESSSTATSVSSGSLVSGSVGSGGVVSRWSVGWANAKCGGQLHGTSLAPDNCPLQVFPINQTPKDWTPPATRDLLYHALARLTITGAGLHVQPTSFAYIGIPQLAHASHPTQTHTVDLDGLAITVTLKAQSFSFDFADGTPPVVTTSPGGPYPDMTIQHTYLTPSTGQHVTLTTVWSASMINPYTGETLSVDGVLTTTEVSDPFPVRQAHISLTDTWEELHNR